MMGVNAEGTKKKKEKKKKKTVDGTKWEWKVLSMRARHKSQGMPLRLKLVCAYLCVSVCEWNRKEKEHLCAFLTSLKDHKPGQREGGGDSRRLQSHRRLKFTVEGEG